MIRVCARDWSGIDGAVATMLLFLYSAQWLDLFAWCGVLD